MNNKIVSMEEKHLKEIESLKTKLSLTLERLQKMKKFQRVNKRDAWYVAYLQNALGEAEKQLESSQNIINQYAKHFQKYGQFYQELEEKLCTSKKQKKQKERGIIKEFLGEPGIAHAR